uniref:Uncharacterized protein n=3 Tax=Homininae TaxID=207598 RepID=A0A2I3T5Q6_PANTR
MTKVQCTLLMRGGWRAVGEMNLHSWVPHSIPSYLKNFTLLKKSFVLFCIEV